MGNAKHDELGEGYALDEQEGAVSAEDAERAFGLACPVRGQDTRGRLNQPKISSAARVKIEASQSQRTTIRTKAPMSAAALNVPRPIHLAMASAVPLTTDERYGPCVQFATVMVQYGHEKTDMLGNVRFRDAEFAAVRDSEFSTDSLLERNGF